jgi:hypothetical protein
MPSSFFPLRVRLSGKTGTRLTSFADGGGDASTHPFHPFLEVARSGARGARSLWCSRPKSGSSLGVCRHLNEARAALDEMYGPVIDVEMEGRSKDVQGGGITDAQRCMVTIWICGRTREKELDVAVGFGMDMESAPAEGTALVRSASPPPSFLSPFFLFSSFRCLCTSSSVRSKGVWGPTPFKRLIGTSGAKLPAKTAVAVLRL